MIRHKRLRLPAQSFDLFRRYWRAAVPSIRAAIRRAIPEASLGEIAAELAIPRGRVQRALERIESAALHGGDAVAGSESADLAPARAEHLGHDGPAASSSVGPAVA